MRLNRQNLDRHTNKPNPKQTEGVTPDEVLNRAHQTRRDDDVIRSPKRTVYDIDYAIKSYIESEIQPQITDNGQLISVPVIFANGEKWDNVRRLGFLRDEKGMLQSPLIMINRGSVTERDSVMGLDVNRNPDSNLRAYQQKYNARNRYEDELFPLPIKQPAESKKIYIVDIPRYVTIEYELMLWCDFTTQMNDLVDQILPYSRFAWGNEGNAFTTQIGAISFETVNTVGQDRLVRATMPLTVTAALLSAQEARTETLRTMFSIKKVVFDMVVSMDIFSTTQVPATIIQSGGGTIRNSSGQNFDITPSILSYLTGLTEKLAVFNNATTIVVNGQAANNPITNTPSTPNEFDVYINGQYIDKFAYAWTPSFAGTQTIVFNTAELGYDILNTDVIIVKGRWA